MTTSDPLGTYIQGKTTSPGGVCEFVTPGSLPSCTLVIFGASGDLTARKLIPAFYSMHLSNNLPEPFTIVGSSRTAFSNEEFREKLREATIDDAGMDGAGWDEFAAKLVYQPVTYDSPETFTELAGFLDELDQEKGTGGNRIFYLAVPPNLYPLIAQQIGDAGLAMEGENGRGWARIVVAYGFASSGLARRKLFHMPSFALRTRSASSSSLRWRETLGWLIPKTACISQTQSFLC